VTATTTVDDVIARATELAGEGQAGPGRAESVLVAAGGDRRQVEVARDRVAAQVRAKVDDFEATATLQLLNRVLAELPIHDPLDWRIRWTQRFRRP